ncbi:DNA polymerase IV [Mucilaginibacter sp. SJ]|uniref:DNA polymerase IV n=1 Tax=Mucilaginibacter sp. SJ TaxID=3029053 RepID=UPI0023A98BEF|nr:DNA polymerase IV [Mucilaginibacter sp. SJ]WEA01707.1 DNA polymerase IV [Mucilaginibacter sp. SJ]
METRSIVHFDLDTFFVSVEVLKDSKLKGKPVAVGGEGDRAVVASCSYEARQFGVRSGMAMKIAKRLCPHLVVRRGDYDSYSQKSQEVTAIIKDAVPIVEKASIDEHYLDLTGFDRYFGTYKYTMELCDRITKETWLPISFGLSVNKLVSKVATTVTKPLGRKQVEFGTERQFFSPLPVKKIPGVGQETGTKLALMGVKLIEDVYKLNPPLLEATFGKNGLVLWQRANAIDETPVVPYSESKSISRESTFSQDTTSMELLRGHIMQMVTELAFELRQNDKMATCVTVKIRYSDFETHTQQRKIKGSSFDEDLTGAAWELFQKLYERRVLIRLIGVKFSQLITSNYQIDLFADTGNNIALYQSIDKLKNKYGANAIIKAAALPINISHGHDMQRR